VVKLSDYYALGGPQRRLQGYQNTPDVFFWNTWLARS